jgi:hypothetical protein
MSAEHADSPARERAVKDAGAPIETRAPLHPLILHVEEQRRTGSVVRTITAGDMSLFFEIVGEPLPPAMRILDFAAIAMIFRAMRAGQPLHIKGSLSKTLLRHLEEFQDAWVAWRPDEYRHVSVTADSLVDDAHSETRRGMFAFSGGVDSAFTLLRHLHGDAGLRTVEPVGMMFVHGMDIPLEESSGFETAYTANAAVARELDLPLYVVRTNWRSVACRNWEMEYATCLAACLHQFTGLVEFGVFGADEDYSRLPLPWGSNPVTNPLLGGGALDLQIDGAGYKRTQRVAHVSNFPEVARHLRVCWKSAGSGRNCGRCEKCVRTKLNFLAVGRKPICFDDLPSFLDVCRIQARNAIQICFLNEILDCARENGIRASWMLAVRVAILRSRIWAPWWRFNGR